MNYNCVRTLAQAHRYASFTKLQESAFSCPEAYDHSKDLFVIGETSSGKTLIPLLIYAAAVKEAAERGDALPKMLFVVPYRALAAQKYEELKQFFEGQDLKIIQSTGEFRQDDDAVQRGQVHVAIIITEKVYKYEARNSSFLSMYDYLVLDEIGLVDSGDRGIRLDFIFAWAHSQKALTGQPRTIALGTPFYDWSAYINSYGFHRVETSDRPVKLTEISATFTPLTVEKVEGESDFLHTMRMMTSKDLQNLSRRFEIPMTGCPMVNCMCPIHEPARNDASRVCPVTKQRCTMPIEYVPDGCGKGSQFLVVKICREHLLAGHQILVFVNDREKVKDLCRMLFHQLRDILPPAPPAEECRKEILAQCGLDGDDVFGILEYEDGASVEQEFYQAFKSGVGFHSAALPNELRTYVEKKLLSSREMKIVCSTETLAFGVNSSVDVVIVADLQKHESAGIRPLTLNEYQNYAGRAGRLRRDLNMDEARGYVYTLIGSKIAPTWQDMRQAASQPERLYSRFHADNGRRLCFFLMNILPTNSADSITDQQLVELVSALPQDGSYTPEALLQKVRTGLKFLLQHKLATKTKSRARGQLDNQTGERYCLTALGSQLRGFILDSEDYLQLLKALEEYTDSLFLDSDKITFLYRLLQTKHAETGLNGIFSGSETRHTLRELRAYIDRHAQGLNHSLTWLQECRDDRVLSILAAILAWSEGESAKTLYRQFGIHYALLAKVAEQLAYLIEIAAQILPFRMVEIWEQKQFIYTERMHVSQEQYEKQVAVKKNDLHKLFAAVYFGINTDIATQLLDFLDPRDLPDEEKDPAAMQLASDLSLHYINPKSARTLRRIAIRYRFFADPPAVDMTNVSARNNYLNQRWQYKKDVEEMGPQIAAFFRTALGERYSD